jgi:hypothetical protein
VGDYSVTLAQSLLYGLAQAVNRLVESWKVKAMKLAQLLFLLSFIGFNLVLGIFLVWRAFSATITQIFCTKHPMFFEPELQKNLSQTELTEPHTHDCS